MIAELRALINALAVAEVEDYMTAQAAPANDSGHDDSEHPASESPAEAA